MSNSLSRNFLLFVFLILSFFISLHAGSVNVSWHEIFSWLCFNKISTQSDFLLSQLRAPRACASLMVGATLAACGLALQTLLRNPLAEPYTLGLSGGSAMGAIAALILGFSPLALWVPAFSTLGCLLSALLVLVLARRQLELESRSLILFGVMLSLFFGAVVVFALSVLSPAKLPTVLVWLMGEFGTTRDVWIYVLAPILMIGLAILVSRAKALDALALGESRALSLGFSPSRERKLLILLTSCLTALSVSIAGLVGFIGLVSPHLARRFLKTASHLELLISSMLIGGGLLSLADSVGRTISTSEIPAGSIAALVGAPVLIFILTGRKHAQLD